jgi:putative membrane-bound dehydrogenase-like protein
MLTPFRSLRGFLLLLPGLLLLVPASPADEKPAFPAIAPLSPREEQATFKVPRGFRVELVASEPDVVDPVAMAFDEQGRLFVAEMRGYPNAGVGTGTITSGRIKMLEDKDGNGSFETCTTFAEGLRFPTAVMPWKNGLLVANAPDLIWLEDSQGQGKADRKSVLYTGFDLANIQQLLNSVQWGLDNWVYATAGNKGGEIRCPDRPEWKPVALRAQGIRFHPDLPGSLQPTSSGGQYGLAPDDWQRYFTNTNSEHLRHIVLPDQYLARNRQLAVTRVTLDIPDHGPACKVHRISPFEGWRVERTTRRKDGPDAPRFPTTELVPGGFITSACSPVIYGAELFPREYRGSSFICDPANNLIHRDVLVPRGATFTARRGEEDCEFLASTDVWFRPVALTIGPDGALYVLDFYREVIETPLSLPEDIKKRLNIESRGRGRIWRIVPEENRRTASKPNLRKAASEELVRHLEDGNIWWRLTCQRLLVERQDKRAVKPLVKLARESAEAVGRAHALWTLQGLEALEDDLIVAALQDRVAEVREQALRLAEDRLANAAVRKAVAALADDGSARVRFQLAFTLGQRDAPELVAALGKVARRDVGDPWTQTAVLSSTSRVAPALLRDLTSDREFLAGGGPAMQMIGRLSATIGARNQEAELGTVLSAITAKTDAGPEAWQLAVLEGLGQGLQNRAGSLGRLWSEPPPALREPVDELRPLFRRAAAACLDEKRPAAERVAAARLLGYGPYEVAGPALKALLSPQAPSELQMAATRSLAGHEDARVADALLAGWSGYSPAVRREAVEALFARADRLSLLLTAIEQKKVATAQLEPSRLQQLRKHPDLKLRERAEKLLAGQVPADRRKVLEDYQPALELKGDRARGRMVFAKNCATCHRLENTGIEVGPDLLSALKTKTAETLLVDILDPSREVDPRFLNYEVTTKKGKTYTGIIAAETSTSITLRRAEKAEDTILRDQIEENGVTASSKSLMPDGLESQLSKQDVADTIAYLLGVVGK